MSFTASDVKELRERTGAGMMDCKKALTETDGDLEKAMEWLQIKGIAKAAKKADRVAADGRVATFISGDGRTGAILEINCETDFVARNEDFAAFCNDLAAQCVAVGATTVEALLDSAYGGSNVEEVRKAKVAAIGENITIRRLELLQAPEGFVAAYVHGEGVKGALIAFKSANGASGSALTELGKQVAMHAVAMGPQFLNQDQVSDEVVENERRLQTEQALESGKPADIVAKMIEGRLRKWKAEICLADQAFVMNPDVTVARFIADAGKEAGAQNLLASAFTLYVRGEGIEKKTANFADEVAAMTGKN
jgi:elongation factor Ts